MQRKLNDHVIEHSSGAYIRADQAFLSIERLLEGYLIKGYHPKRCFEFFLQGAAMQQDKTYEFDLNFYFIFYRALGFNIAKSVSEFTFKIITLPYTPIRR